MDASVQPWGCDARRYRDFLGLEDDSLVGPTDEDTTSTSTPAAPSLASPDAPPPQAPPSGPITRARARELNFVMLLKNEGPEE